MTWLCVICGQRAVAEVDAGVPAMMCAEHRATFEGGRSWCSVPDCTVPTHTELCEVHGRLVALV